MDYRSAFRKDPFKVLLDIQSFKDGVYLVEGSVGAEGWKSICEALNAVSDKGGCSLRLEWHKKKRSVQVVGTVDLEMERMCVRTLEPFMSKEQVTIEETLTLDPELAQDDMDVLIDEVVNVGEFVTDYVVIGMNPYPVKDASKSPLDTEIIVSDGYEEVGDEEKNPFSVLKHLKSN